MNRFSLLAVSLVVNLFLFSSAFGQVKLPPEELGFLNERLLKERTDGSNWLRVPTLDFELIQKQLQQRNENLCSKLESAPQFSKSILTRRLARAMASDSKSAALDNLICGIEEFALYDATQVRFITRRFLNRARQFTININDSDTSLKFLMRAYEHAIASYKTDIEFLADPKHDDFPYAQEGVEIASLIIETTPTILDINSQITAVQNGIVWLAADLTADRSSRRYENDFMDLLFLLTEEKNTPAVQRYAKLNAALESKVTALLK